MEGSAFLRKVVAVFPYQIHKVLTDNGMAFADLPKNRHGPNFQAIGAHIFDRVCNEHGVDAPAIPIEAIADHLAIPEFLTVMAKIQSSSNVLFVALILPLAKPTTSTRSPCATNSRGSVDVSIDLDAVSSRSASPACPWRVPASGQSSPGMIHSMSSASLVNALAKYRKAFQPRKSCRPGSREASVRGLQGI
jgi:hypothetical protein